MWFFNLFWNAYESYSIVLAPQILTTRKFSLGLSMTAFPILLIVVKLLLVQRNLWQVLNWMHSLNHKLIVIVIVVNVNYYGTVFSYMELICSSVLLVVLLDVHIDSTCEVYKASWWKTTWIFRLRIWFVYINFAHRQSIIHKLQPFRSVSRKTLECIDHLDNPFQIWSGFVYH